MRAKTAFLVITAIALAPTSALAQVGHLTKDELKCVSTLTSAFAKFTSSKAKCIEKCVKKARKTSGPYDECRAPFTGATAACISDPVKGAEAKARAAIDKNCAGACPQCHDCDDGVPVIADIETTIDNLAMEIYCVEREGRTATKAQAKCEGAVNKAVTKLVAARVKCYGKCDAAITKGKLADGSCYRWTQGDATTAECLATADEKAAAAIDKACSEPAAAPGCFTGATSADWVARGDDLTDVQDPEKPDGSSCTDGLSCTNDTCRLGRCARDLRCNASNLCQWGECDVETDQCMIHNVECHQPDDPCFSSSCSTASGICLTECTAAFGCGSGTGQCGFDFGCTSNAECDDHNLCTDDVCLTASGLCSNSPVICDDGDACTVDYCDNPDVGCQVTQRPPGYCNGDESVACTEDVCVPHEGCTVHRPHDAACDDGDPCTIDDCDPSAGCVHRAACDDGDPCTNDTCDSVDFSCTNHSICDDDDPCTTDICHIDQAPPCSHVPASCPG